MERLNIAVFVSGSGTNCENLIRYFMNTDNIRVALVVSNKPEAYALVRAQRLNVPTAVVTKAELNNEDVMMPLLQQHAVGMIVLAGFLPLVPNFLVEAFPRRIINIHPSLLPKYGGKGMWGRHVHVSFNDTATTETGMTVHYVSNVCDGGEIIAQFRVAVSPDDSVDEIMEKEHQLEMRHFPVVIEKLIEENNNN